MVRLTDHRDMTIAVDWDIKSQTKQNQIHYTTQRTYLNEGSTTSFLVNPQEAVITKDSIATGSSKTGCTYVDPIHHIYINCWLPVYRWSVMDKQVTSTPPIPGNGGVLVTCIYITDHL